MPGAFIRLSTEWFGEVDDTLESNEGQLVVKAVVKEACLRDRDEAMKR